MKPKIFIGSSKEGLPIADAIQAELQYTAFTEIWSQIDFLSSTTLDTLIEKAINSNFAIFVFTPDDILHIRNNEVKAVRDNVIFECGLFMGAIDRFRVYFIKPRGVDIHLPTDLWGITPGEYDPEHENPRAAVGPFCREVERLIKKYYSFEFPKQGKWGINLLNEDTITIEDGNQYTLYAKIPKGGKLILKFEYNTSSDIGFNMSDKKGFETLEKDSIGIKAMDLEVPEGENHLLVSSKSCVKISAYINGQKDPWLTKEFKPVK